MAGLGAALPRLVPHRPLLPQLERALREHRAPGGTDLVTSCPGEALARFRRLCYSRLGLAEPACPAVPRPVPLPAPPRPAPPRPPPQSTAPR
ncbi:hypothetical protein I3J09_19140 [Streptomyces clavuligerus]|uniref:Uncharacterized protein n=1 Tax=Streptomyces clavuligerus TaxID=1901 RepID=B5GV62_STRCL|nr:hypothetical protein [Streptomyces clavuligerus]ANW20132.1 hypothetical protein BB341_18890 [Streptomyces clavuligerus]AXU14758.1 hypothetical protein D1794_19710 [Streptomyces clavuligerus]EDY50208.1 hypothetical protein SSCG_02971 [Streptomyces clavuligerus]EFG06961.1 Hypothetical protein SCLAV_1888 [Streptomyces clavuligerus]MBY6304785.1 hypothetical protein [Streptomyces clavuligerus]